MVRGVVCRCGLLVPLSRDSFVGPGTPRYRHARVPDTQQMHRDAERKRGGRKREGEEREREGRKGYM